MLKVWVYEMWIQVSDIEEPWIDRNIACASDQSRDYKQTSHLTCILIIQAERVLLPLTAAPTYVVAPDEGGDVVVHASF